MARLRDKVKLKNIRLEEIEGFDDQVAPLNEVLQMSLIEVDQKDPIKLRKNGNGLYQLIDGRRRFEAEKARGSTNIMALVQEEVDDTELHLQALIANSGTPNEWDEACHIIALEEKGYKGDEIAKMVGYSPATISTRKRLVEKLHPEFQQQLKVGGIKVSTALELTKLPLTEQEELIGEKLTYKAAFEAVKEYNSGEVQFELPTEDVEFATGLFISGENMKQLLEGNSITIDYQGEDLTLNLGKEIL